MAAPNSNAASWLEDVERARPVMRKLLQEQTRKVASSYTKGVTFPIPSVLRVFQLDGERLEFELTKILRQQLGRVFSAYDDSLFFRWQDEWHLALSTLLCGFTFWQHNQFYGDRLQNVLYRSETKAEALGTSLVVTAAANTAPSISQKLLYVTISLIVPYVFRKLQSRALDENWSAEPRDSWKHRVQRYLELAEKAVSLLEVGNFVLFLYYGKYRSLADRIARLRLVYGTQRMSRVVNLEYLNHQIYWTVVFNFVSFILPLFHLGKVWRMLAGFRGRSDGQATGTSDGRESDLCPACGQPVSLPRVANCGHRYCYYCIQSRLSQDESFQCPRCGGRVNSAKAPPPHTQ